MPQTHVNILTGRYSRFKHFLRIMAAVLYDGLLLLAVLFLATAIALPFNKGQAFSSEQFLYPLWLLSVSFVFYGWFWTHGGQTLGLRSWKLTLQSLNKPRVTWFQAFIRFMAALLSWACLGLGFLWILIDKNSQSWHDHLSGTQLMLNSAQTHDAE